MKESKKALERMLNQAGLSVYRIPASMPLALPEKAEPLKDRSAGLIRLSQPKPHVCSKPDFWIHFWYWITFRSIQEGSLWRCAECEKVFLLHRKYGGGIYDWRSTHPISGKIFNEDWDKAIQAKQLNLFEKKSDD